MKDYTFIRPGIAVTISAVTLALALVIGLWLIFSLNEAAQTVARGARTSATLHRYNAGLEVWRQMATGTDPRFQRVEAACPPGNPGEERPGPACRPPPTQGGPHGTPPGPD